ncbi:MAG: hypothetical protein ABI366_00745 [Ginsengibacter sp.]
MITLPQIKTEELTGQEKKQSIYSIGLVFPFYPSMVDKNTIQEILNYTLEVVQAKLESLHTEVEIKQICRRLQKIFKSLNYNSHRKSVAIIIEGEEEKVINLNYSGKPVFLFNETFSLLDLVGNSIQNPEFELLVFKKDGAELYEYFNNSLHKVFGQTEEFCSKAKTDSDCLIRSVSDILKRVNSKNDKPIFVYSEDEYLTNKFCEFFPFKEITFKINISSDEDLFSKIQLLVNRIIKQWDFQQTKLVKGQIAIAKRTDTLYSRLNNVISALKHSDNGLLLIDRFMKDEIHNTSRDESLFVATQKLNSEIEKFLARGNRIEITEGGVLENLGGIAFIKDHLPKFQSTGLPRKYKEGDFIFE